MRPTLFHIPDTLFHLPLFGAGLLLAVWAAFGLILLVWLVRRQGFNADTRSYLPLLLIVAAAIYWLLPSLDEPGQGLPIRSYGLMMLLGIVTGTLLAIRRARPLGMNSDQVVSMVFWIVVPGILGARAFYVIEYWTDFRRLTADGSLALLPTVGAVLNIAQGGLVVYGSYIGGLIGLFAFARRYGQAMLALGDLIVPSVALGMVFGRLGCLMNGCCFGDLCELPWAMTFPFGSPPYVHQVEKGQLFLHGLKLRDGTQGAPTIADVEPGSPAAQAGLAMDQQILAINGYPIHSVGEARTLLFQVHEPGQTLSVTTAESTAPHRWKYSGPPPRSLAVHPAQAYGSINGLILVLLLLAYAPFRRRDGELLALMMTVYPITRFLQECLRTDEPPALGTPMTISQNVSVLMFLTAMGLWFYLLRRRPYNVAVGR
jgi:phosphatidylglycerol:prolipoprotein diacylglycerol transferase